MMDNLHTEFLDLEKAFDTVNHDILLSLIFIYIAIKTSETFHFAVDTCLLNIKESVNKINKVVNKDLQFLI